MLRQMFRRVSSVLSVCVLFACGSGGGGEDQPDASASASDASAIQCTQTLEIGHCVDSATGEPCLDFEAPGRMFVPLTGTENVRPIVGPQGSDMFVFAVRAANIHPGTETDPPMVEIKVFYGDEERGGYLSWPIFFAEGDKQTAPQLFTVIFDSPAIEGETMRVTGEVVDPSGNHFCGETSFVCGELIPGDTNPHG